MLASYRFFIQQIPSFTFLNLPKVISLAVTLFTLPIILRSVSLHEYGIYQLTLAFTSLANIAFGSRIGTASKRGIANNLNGTFLYAFRRRITLFSVPGLFILGIISLLNSYFEFYKISLMIVLVQILGFYTIAGHPFESSYFEYLIAKKSFGKWSIFQSIFCSIPRILSVGVLAKTKNIVFFATSLAGFQLIIVVSLWIHLVTKDNLIEEYKNGNIDPSCISFSFVLTLRDILSNLSDHIAVFIVTYLFGSSQLAIFSIAQKMRDSAAGIIKSVSQLVYADISRLDENDFRSAVKSHFLAMFALGIFSTVLLGVAGVIYVSIFLPESAREARYYFVLLLLTFPLGAIGLILHTYLESHFFAKKLLISTILPSILTIGTTYFLGVRYGIVGISVAGSLDVLFVFLTYYILTMYRWNTLHD